MFFHFIFVAIFAYHLSETVTVANDISEFKHRAHVASEDVPSEFRAHRALAVSQTPRLRGKASKQLSVLHYQEGSGDAGTENHSLSASTLANYTKVSGTQPEPRVFFLFLTLSGIKRPELWRAFFDGQPVSRWRVFVHCKHSNICASELSVGNLLNATQVATVPSTYCTDLVTPMVQLLQASVQESVSPNDKFVFLSETTLPVKPFLDVYSTLTWDRSSDFCVYPTDHWVDLGFKGMYPALMVKHSQWVVLNQAHAKAMVADWPSVEYDLRWHWSIPVYHEPRKGPWGKITNPNPYPPLPRCMDEWAIFATLFGAFVNKGQRNYGHPELPGFGGPPLQLHGNASLSQTTQGICRTFAFWDAAEFSSSNLVNEIEQDWPRSKLSCFPSCDTSHPAEFEAISDRGVVALRRSRYLFARKFRETVLTMDQFQRIILSQQVPPPSK